MSFKRFSLVLNRGCRYGSFVPRPPGVKEKPTLTPMQIALSLMASGAAGYLLWELRQTRDALVTIEKDKQLDQPNNKGDNYD